MLHSCGCERLAIYGHQISRYLYSGGVRTSAARFASPSRTWRATKSFPGWVRGPSAVAARESYPLVMRERARAITINAREG